MQKTGRNNREIKNKEGIGRRMKSQNKFKEIVGRANYRTVFAFEIGTELRFW